MLACTHRPLDNCHRYCELELTVYPGWYVCVGVLRTQPCANRNLHSGSDPSANPYHVHVPARPAPLRVNHHPNCSPSPRSNMCPVFSLHFASTLTLTLALTRTRTLILCMYLTVALTLTPRELGRQAVPDDYPPSRMVVTD